MPLSILLVADQRSGAGETVYSNSSLGYSDESTHAAGAGGIGNVATLLVVLAFVAVAALVIVQIRRRNIPRFRTQAMSAADSAASKAGSSTPRSGATQAQSRIPADLLPQFALAPEFVLAPVSFAKVMLERIEARDPQFDAERFLECAEFAWLSLQRAEMYNDAQAGRALLTPTEFAVWRKAITARIAQRARLLLAHVEVVRAAYCAASQDALRERITIQLDAICTMALHDLKTQHTTPSYPELTEFRVRLTFERQANALSPKGGGALAGRCCACGKPLEIVDEFRCALCRADVCSGRYDWTISELIAIPAADLGHTSNTGYTARFETDLEPLLGRDPIFDPRLFCQRVGAVFMQVYRAFEARDPACARAFMNETQALAWQMRVESLRLQGRSNRLDGLRILAISLIGVELGAHFDTLTLRIEAEAADFEVDEADRIVRGTADVRPLHEAWSFRRSIYARTDSRIELPDAAWLVSRVVRIT